MVRLYPAFNKFSADTESPTTDLYLPRVMARKACEKHKVPEGIPCFYIPKKDESGYLGAICNDRAIRAGFDNPIRPESLDRSIGRTAMAKR